MSRFLVPQMFLNDFLQTKTNVPIQLSVLTERATILLDSRTIVLATPDTRTTELDRDVKVRFIKLDSSDSIQKK